MNRRQQILAAMDKATPQEQMQLLAELDSIRGQEDAERASHPSIDLHAHLEPVAVGVTSSGAQPYTPHTASTDWLDNLDVIAAEDIEHKMAAEAGLWWRQTSEGVKRDPHEFMEQARGKARHAALSHGASHGRVLEAAQESFLSEAVRLHRIAFKQAADTEREPTDDPEKVRERLEGTPGTDYIDPDDPVGTEIKSESPGSAGDLTSKSSSQTMSGPVRTAKEDDKDESDLDEALFERAEEDVKDDETSIDEVTDSTDDEDEDDEDSTKEAAADDPPAQSEDMSFEDGTGNAAADVADVPTPGQTVADYPQPGTTVEGDTPDFPLETSAQRTAVSLTNVGIEGDHGVGTDPDGKRVQFRLSAEDKQALKQVLYSDMSVNFSGVDVSQDDIISTSSKTAAEGDTCKVCGDSIAKDDAQEDPATWHHDSGTKHDHEAKPGGSDGSDDSSKESSLRSATTQIVQQTAGVSLDDLPAQPWAAWADMGVPPHLAAELTLEDVGYPTQRKMAALWDVVAYTYKADIYCPEHMVEKLIQEGKAPASARGVDHQTAINQAAEQAGIDWGEEETFDSGEWPKVVFRDQLEGYHCGMGHPITASKKVGAQRKQGGGSLTDDLGGEANPQSLQADPTLDEADVSNQDTRVFDPIVLDKVRPASEADQGRTEVDVRVKQDERTSSVSPHYKGLSTEARQRVEATLTRTLTRALHEGRKIPVGTTVLDKSTGVTYRVAQRFTRSIVLASEDGTHTVTVLVDAPDL